MKFYLKLLVGIIITTHVYTQQSFEIEINTPNTATPFDIDSDIISNTIIVGADKIPLQSYFSNAFIVKVNPQREYITRFFFNDSLETELNNVIVINEDRYFCIGSRESESNNGYRDKLWTIIVDGNLNTISENIYDVPEEYDFHKMKLTLKNDTVFSIGQAHYKDGNGGDLVLVKFNLNGEVLFSSYTYNYAWVFDLINTSNGIAGLTKSYTNQRGNFEILTIEDDLSFSVQVINSPYSCSGFGSFIFSNNKYFTFTRLLENGQDGSFIQRINENAEYEDGLFIYREGYDERYADFKAIDYYDSDNIYFAISGDYLNYLYVNSEVGIGIIDENLNPKGLEYYGGDLNYALMAINATPDGGCVAAGSKYYWQDSTEYDVDIWIKKVMPNDIISSDSETTTYETINITIFPNPANEYLSINSSNSEIQFQMYSLKGKLLIDRFIVSNTIEIIPIQNTPKGTYIYKISDVSQNTILKTGKFIKQ